MSGNVLEHCLGIAGGGVRRHPWQMAAGAGKGRLFADRRRTMTYLTPWQLSMCESYNKSDVADGVCAVASQSRAFGRSIVRHAAAKVSAMGAHVSR